MLEPQKNTNNRNQIECFCCGSMVPYPTEPGEWQFAEIKYKGELFWVDIDVREYSLNPNSKDDCDKTLELFRPKDCVDGPKNQQIYWPENAKWRRRL